MPRASDNVGSGEGGRDGGRETIDPHLRASPTAPPARTRIRRFLPALLLLGAFAIFVLARATGILSFETLIESRAGLRAAVERNFVVALLGFFAAYVVFAALAVPAGFLLTLAGGLLFGAPLGGTVAVAGATTGGTILFLAARGILHDFLQRRIGGVVRRIRSGFQRTAWSYMLFLRLTPLIPFWVVNIAAALAGVPLRTFLWTTALGIVPITFIVAFGGENLDRLATESAAMLTACRASGEIDCHAQLTFAAILSPRVLALLGSASAVALLPALVRARSARRSMKARGKPAA